jgi:cell division protein FtsL
MRMPFFLMSVLLTVFLAVSYIAKHNRLTELRIKAMSLERDVRMEEAEKKRLELEREIFLSPVRLMTVARKAQYSHLRKPSTDEIITIEEP